MKSASLSVEIGHLYLQELREKEDEAAQKKYVEDRMMAGAIALAPVIQTYRRHGQEVSTSVLIDDYFWTPGAGPTPEELAILIEHWHTNFQETYGISIDFIVFESSLADTVKTLHRRIVSLPKEGAGSGAIDASALPSWISNGQELRPNSNRMDPEPKMGLSPRREEGRTLGQTPRPHAVRIDVELYSEKQGKRVWACPLLAAWWQLVRLGMLRDERDAPTIPAKTIDLSDGKRTLFAKRTLTALNPQFVEIEVAVWTILSQTSLPDNWLKTLRDRDDMPGRLEHLDRIAYVFLSDKFHAHGLEKFDKWI